MDNFSQRGQVLTLTAPDGGVVSGTGYQIGSLVVVAVKSVAAGSPFPALVKGVVDVTKVGDEVWGENEKIYFDESEGKFTEDSDTSSNPLVGTALTGVAADVLIESDALASDLAIDGLTLTVLDYASLSGAAVTITVGGVATTVTEEESGDWEAGTSDDDTATSLAAALDAIDGISATATDDVVTIVPGTGATSLSPVVGRVRLDGVTR
jgi:predicted RecA/RadA family phage recombinase